MKKKWSVPQEYFYLFIILIFLILVLTDKVIRLDKSIFSDRFQIGILNHFLVNYTLLFRIEDLSKSLSFFSFNCGLDSHFSVTNSSGQNTILIYYTNFRFSTTILIFINAPLVIALTQTHCWWGDTFSLFSFFFFSKS